MGRGSTPPRFEEIRWGVGDVIRGWDEGVAWVSPPGYGDSNKADALVFLSKTMPVP